MRGLVRDIVPSKQFSLEKTIRKRQITIMSSPNPNDQKLYQQLLSTPVSDLFQGHSVFLSKLTSVDQQKQLFTLLYQFKYPECKNPKLVLNWIQSPECKPLAVFLSLQILLPHLYNTKHPLYLSTKQIFHFIFFHQSESFFQKNIDHVDDDDDKSFNYIFQTIYQIPNCLFIQFQRVAQVLLHSSLNTTIRFLEYFLSKNNSHLVSLWILDSFIKVPGFFKGIQPWFSQCQSLNYIVSIILDICNQHDYSLKFRSQCAFSLLFASEKHNPHIIFQDVLDSWYSQTEFTESNPILFLISTLDEKFIFKRSFPKQNQIKTTKPLFQQYFKHIAKIWESSGQLAESLFSECSTHLLYCLVSLTPPFQKKYGFEPFMSMDSPIDFILPIQNGLSQCLSLGNNRSTPMSVFYLLTQLMPSSEKVKHDSSIVAFVLDFRKKFIQDIVVFYEYFNSLDDIFQCVDKIIPKSDVTARKTDTQHPSSTQMVPTNIFDIPITISNPFSISSAFQNSKQFEKYILSNEKRDSTGKNNHLTEFQENSFILSEFLNTTESQEFEQYPLEIILSLLKKGVEDDAEEKDIENPHRRKSILQVEQCIAQLPEILKSRGSSFSPSELFTLIQYLVHTPISNQKLFDKWQYSICAASVYSSYHHHLSFFGANAPRYCPQFIGQFLIDNIFQKNLALPVRIGLCNIVEKLALVLASSDHQFTFDKPKSGKVKDLLTPMFHLFFDPFFNNFRNCILSKPIILCSSDDDDDDNISKNLSLNQFSSLLPFGLPAKLLARVVIAFGCVVAQSPNHPQRFTLSFFSILEKIAICKKPLIQSSVLEATKTVIAVLPSKKLVHHLQFLSNWLENTFTPTDNIEIKQHLAEIHFIVQQKVSEIDSTTMLKEQLLLEQDHDVEQVQSVFRLPTEILK